ncbi:SA1362 family protein [Salipaludibacillus daqingensis]|uniref:SA1362 family protein n=1 Tax=Salipaludibacillus daqingensis TaxID=3041001 RepID=UPI002473A71E|nr:SA1362 family protein [Salipaludibacillus daqingensis]
MFRQSYHPVVITLLSLAAIGIGVQLITNPAAFITQILVTIGIVALILIIIKNVVMPRLMRRQASFSQQRSMSAHRAAPKKKKTASFSNKQKEKKKHISRPLVKRQSDVKLTVIEGKKNKNKKKSRALF